MKKPNFKIEHLDHVAIRVRDIELSAKWYEKVLGLMPFHDAEWGPWPVLMLAGSTGIALFPSKKRTDVSSGENTSVFIDHFAFKLSQSAFEKARQHLISLNIQFDWQDHLHFHSLHFLDPDGHKLELTCLVNPEDPPY
jgi:catechol-2,3-dioxygenase